MTFHIIIQQERRTAKETPMGIDTSRLSIDIAAQLHTLSNENLADRDWSDPQYVGVFEWDGSAPYIIQHKGDYASRTMGYAGWPSMTKEEHDALAVPQAA